MDPYIERGAKMMRQLYTIPLNLKKNSVLKVKSLLPLRSLIVVLILLGLVVGSAIYLSLLFGGEAKSLDSVEKSEGDVFVGRILNRPFEGTILAIVQADLDCRGNITAVTCRAIMVSTDVGRLEFQYTHNMARQPCLSPGDRVVVFATGGKAVVRKIDP